MGRLYANTLYHFTRSFDKIIDILKNGFNPRCIEENLECIYGTKTKELSSSRFMIPMICFCDIPLSQIEQHSRCYGSYAVGISKKWGEQMGINPVMYEVEKSNVISKIKDCIYKALPYSAKEELIYFSWYLKPYEGKDKVIYYNEREWRYIPKYEELIKKGYNPYMFCGSNKKSIINKFNDECAKKFNIDFKADDIKYIIVKKEEEVLKMVDNITSIKSKYSEEDKKLLTTKIISMERIIEDF